MRQAIMSTHKLKRLLNSTKQKYEFVRTVKDGRGEPVRDADGNVTYEPVDPTPLKGFYHETGVFFTQIGTDGSTVRSKPQPMIIAFLEDTKDIKKEDVVFIDGKRYDVILIRDVENWGLFGDISLELFEDGQART